MVLETVSAEADEPLESASDKCVKSKDFVDLDILEKGQVQFAVIDI